VPNSGSDGVLFAALAVLCTCLLHFSSFSAVWVLLAGAAWEALVLPFNLGRLSNAFALWLGIDPPQLFFFVFLPPILLDAALSIKWYSFLKLRHHILAYAFLIVVAGVVATPPFLLYVLHLNAAGWQVRLPTHSTYQSSD